MPALYPRLWRYALVLCGNKEGADDLAQATCLRAIEQAQHYKTDTHLDRWVFRMAHRIWLNELRSQSVRRGGGLLPIEDLDLADEKPGAETNIFAREVLSIVYALPEAQRVTVLLVYVEGYRYAEASEILEVPLGTIMSRLSAARRTINRQTAETSEETG
ncbi:MAG: RNA polymerase sigma factor [Pseudomonadota bacterium]